MPRERKRYFEPHDVDALIPRLTEILGPLMDVYGKILELRSELRGEQRRIMVIGGGLVDREAWRERSQRLDALTRTLQQGMAAIQELGGVPKDLRMGLVDFPALREDSEVNLCWRFGETAVRFWHGLDEGFVGRKPLDEADG